MKTIDFNISLINKYKFGGCWIIDHNFGPQTHLVDTIKAVRKKYPKLWIGANFLGGDTDSLIPFLIKHGLIINHNTKKNTSKKDNILNGLWVDNGGIRLTKQHEKTNKTVGKYAFDLASLRSLQFKHYKIKDFLYFGGIDFKYQGQIRKLSGISGGNDGYIKEISDLGRFASAGFMDIVCTSGAGTGQSADVDKMKAFTKATRDRSLLAVASGVSPENVSNYIGNCDFILIATGVSYDFHTFDEKKMKALRDAIDNWKPSSVDNNEHKEKVNQVNSKWITLE